MATKTVSDDQAATASTADLAQAADPTAEAVVTHDRPVTPTGEGRIRFKGHAAKAGYPFRIYEGQVEALVDGAWVVAEDAQPVE